MLALGVRLHMRQGRDNMASCPPLSDCPPLSGPSSEGGCGLSALPEASLGRTGHSGTGALICEKKVSFRCNLGLRCLA